MHRSDRTDFFFMPAVHLQRVQKTHLDKTHTNVSPNLDLDLDVFVDKWNVRRRAIWIVNVVGLFY